MMEAVYEQTLIFFHMNDIVGLRGCKVRVRKIKQMPRRQELKKKLSNCFGLVKRNLDDFMEFLVQLSSSGS